MPAVVLGLVVGVVACDEQTPTGIGDAALPGEPVTVVVDLPWSDFASNLEVFGGYGSPRELGHGVLARAFAGTLNARTLVKFAPYPTQATVRDSSGTNRTDTDLTLIGGRLVAYLDTIASTNTGPVTLGLGATLSEWEATSANWTLAVDTIGDQRAWPEAGAGPVTDITTTVWDPALGDSVFFDLDSATVAAWADTTDAGVGARLELLTDGFRLQVNRTQLRLDARPSLDPDTLVELTGLVRRVTFVYDPAPAPPVDGMRVGGVPAWRTLLDLGLPSEINGPPEFCAVVSCPHTLEAGEVSSATLVLTSRATDPAFQPSDSVRLDVRPVFLRSAMPKAPLGNSLIIDIFGRVVAPEAFGAQAGELVEIPITRLARDLIAGMDVSGLAPPNTLALLSILEPLSLAYASFEGPGGVGSPYLRLILTIGPSVELP